MTKTNMDLPELMAKHDQGDVLRSLRDANDGSHCQSRSPCCRTAA